MTTLPLLSTILPPCDHTSQWVHTLPSPVALPSAKPGGRPAALYAWASFRNPAVSLGNSSKPAFFMAPMRCTTALPAQPMGTAIHLFFSTQYDLHTSYQPPYLPPRWLHTSVTSTSLSGYWCASSKVEMMMSGPLPTLAATAALGRTSSQPSLSTRTGTLYFAVKALVFSSHLSSSPWTKRFQRSTRSVAPFSGVHLAAPCANASPDNMALPAPSDPAAAAPAVVFRKSRLVNFDIASPPYIRGRTPVSRVEF